MTKPSKIVMEKHALSTRLVHAGLAIAIITQLATSLVMVKPKLDQAENIWFEIHEYSGLTAFALAFIFWLTLFFRGHGSEPALLFPWFSGKSRKALAEDAVRHFRDLTRFRLTPYDPNAALPGAIHGLGLLLVTAMGVTGGLFYVAMLTSQTDASFAKLAISLHEPMSKLVWAYIVGHAGMGTIHHFAHDVSLSEMWSFRTRGSPPEENRQNLIL